ncbi:ABC transporter substrate-binding protein [Sulfurimonas sp. HSL3-2]|uniref:MlaC/ttg2D family ABC transporter substrate-binding protein n=1 Tax=Hydrocurvibacter mobilis TaxID=3131936 RepID=UPI0031F74ED9
MKSFLMILIFGMFLTLNASVEDDITDMMVKNSEKVTGILKDKVMPKEEQDAEIIRLVDPLFDFNLMGKLCLGKSIYNTLTKVQKNNFHVVFNKKIKESYINKLHLYTDEKLEFEKAQRVKATRITLLSYLITKTEKKPVLYKFYENDEKQWLIYDVDIFGVSIVQTYRNQFSAALKTKSFEQFLDELDKDKTEQ